MLLLPEPIVLNGRVLEMSEESAGGKATAKTTKGAAVPFAPRTAPSRPRAGFGHARKTVALANAGPSGKPEKGQDDFRKMLGL